MRKNPINVSKSYDEAVPCDSCADGWMIERQGKYGTFFGCSEYPFCKYTMSYDSMMCELGLYDPDDLDAWDYL